MDFDPLRSDAPLIAYIDIKSPYAFIALRPTYRLADALGIEVDWRPLTLDIPSYLGSARLGKSGEVVEQNRTPEQWTGVKYAYRDARRYARLEGFVLRGTEKIWNTRLVHIAMLWAKRHGAAVLRDFLEAVYIPFWQRDLDVEDIAVVGRVLQASGADAAGFAEWAAGEGGELHDAMQTAIFEAGIFGVPGYVVAGEYFWGREHLPMVRWLLEGQPGHAPDVANVRVAP